MYTKRHALLSGILFIMLVTSACGGAAATEAPTQPPQNYIPRDPAATEAPATEAPAYSPDMDVFSPTYVAPNSQAPQSNREPYDMFFQDYGVNPLIDTEDDHLSTFALDVDTGSYTIMRNYLNEGNLPPSDSVRVEEYINYFNQGYSNPALHQSFGISMDGAPSPFTQSERYHMLRIGI